MGLRKITTGDVFAIKIENSEYYYFGRILFDVKEQYDNSGNALCYLDWHNSSVLIETYKHISTETNIDQYDVAVKSTFIPKKDLLRQDIQIVKNILVNPQKVSFPETMKNIENKTYFAVGELALETDIPSDYVYDNIKVFPTMGNLYYLQLATLDYSGRRDLIEEKEDIIDNYFAFSDLRSLPQKRLEVYQAIDEDSTQSYYELALKHGFDLARFY